MFEKEETNGACIQDTGVCLPIRIPFFSVVAVAPP